MISGLLGIFGGAMNRMFTGMEQQQQRQFDMHMADYQHNKNVEMWNMMNEYNHPTQQMARLQQAGLSPHLVYGSGSAVTTSQAQLPKYQAPGGSYWNTPNTDWNAVAQLFLNGRMNAAQVKNLEEQNALIKADAALRMQQTAHESYKSLETQARTAKSKFELDYLNETKLMSMETMAQNVRNMALQAAKMEAETKTELARGELTRYMSAHELDKHLLTKEHVKNEPHRRYGIALSNVGQAYDNLAGFYNSQFLGREWDLIKNPGHRRFLDEYGPWLDMGASLLGGYVNYRGRRR